MLAGERLSKLGLISGNKIQNIFNSIYSDVMEVKYLCPSHFLNSMWGRYIAGEVSLNGAVFEGLLATLLYRENLLPLFIQARIAFVPNVEFDFVLYSRELGPIALSAKTSLRERYKQADLEGMMLRQVHRRSENYLLTLSKSEANTVNNKIQKNEVLGLNSVVLATEYELDKLITKLKELTLFKPGVVEIVTCSRLVE